MSILSIENKLKFKTILIVVSGGIAFGFIYNYLFYPHRFTEYLEAISSGMFIGLFIGIVEEFLLKRIFQKVAFYKVTLIRAFLYSLFISLTLSLVLSIEISIKEQISYSDALVFYFQSPPFMRDYFFSLAFVFIILVFVQFVQLIGLKNLVRLLVGHYHKPREVKRIFMFIDLNNSTPLAEKIGNELYSSFVKEYINDVSDAINLYGGEIYQYVGDEVSVVWSLSRKNDNCLHCFLKIKEIVEGKREQYLARFGDFPKFKAGAHIGAVVVTEVGKSKKELAYHGDVVNTTSRIMGKCNELNQEFLISEDLLAIVDQTNITLVEQGELSLKGKAKKISLFGVHKHDAINATNIK
jgi:adenylate cyclase